MSLCRAVGCTGAKPAGRGRQYCVECSAQAKERKRVDAIRRSKEWREANQERARARDRARYIQTAETHRNRAREWYYANPDRVQAQRVKKRANRAPRVNQYGIKVADYDQMLAAQGGACAICARTENGKRRFFDVDHDHATGAVRGLLCNRCNRMLSNALDDVALLSKAIDYLAPAVREVAS